MTFLNGADRTHMDMHRFLVTRDPDTTGKYVCNGSNDDDEIHDAIAWMADTFGGGPISLGPGIFKYTADALQLDRSNVTLLGAGPQATILQPDTDSINGIEVDQDVDQVYIRDLSINFASGLTTPLNGIVFNGPASGPGHYIGGIDNVYISDIGAIYYGVVINSGLYIPVRRVFVMDGGGLIKLETTHAAHKPLNSTISESRCIIKKANSASTIKILGTHTKENILHFESICTYIDGGSLAADEYHIELNNSEFIDFTRVTCEGGLRFLNATGGCKVLTFDHHFIYTEDVGTKIFELGDATGCKIRDSWLGGCTVYSDVASNILDHCTEYVKSGTWTERDNW